MRPRGRRRPWGPSQEVFDLPDWQPQLVPAAEVAGAKLPGGRIGFERELAHKPAGFRTHRLVAGATALFAGLGLTLTTRFAANFPSGAFRADPVRVLQAIMTGVSPLGAGTIFRRDGGCVEGLTTAATILPAAGVGLAIALERYVAALAVTLLALVVLRLTKSFENLRKRAE